MGSRSPLEEKGSHTARSPGQSPKPLGLLPSWSAQATAALASRRQAHGGSTEKQSEARSPSQLGLPTLTSTFQGFSSLLGGEELVSSLSLSTVCPLVLQ